MEKGKCLHDCLLLLFCTSVCVCSVLREGDIVGESSDRKHTSDSSRKNLLIRDKSDSMYVWNDAPTQTIDDASNDANSSHEWCEIGMTHGMHQYQISSWPYTDTTQFYPANNCITLSGPQLIERKWISVSSPQAYQHQCPNIHYMVRRMSDHSHNSRSTRSILIHFGHFIFFLPLIRSSLYDCEYASYLTHFGSFVFGHLQFHMLIVRISECSSLPGFRIVARQQ